MNYKLSLSCLAGLGLTTSLLAVNPDPKPNILFILTDDLGYGDVGILFQNQLSLLNSKSQPFTSTPNLDLLARQGVQLRHHYCPAPVSAPSRASLLTGLNQGHANIRNNQFDKELENNHTIATVLKAAGYSTALIGKWGMQGQTDTPPDWPAHPNIRGFDYFLGYIRHVDGHEHYPKEGKYRGAKEVYENYTNIAYKLDKCYTADLWTAAAKKWITSQQKESNGKKPFFMLLAYDTPHAVLELPTQPYPAGGGLNGGMQWLNEPGHMINTASGEIDSWIHPDYASATYDNDKNPATPEIPWPDVFKRYATDTRRIDDAVSDLMQLLKDLNIDRNTLVIFTSDNGPSKESYLAEEYNPDFFKGYGPFDGIKRDCYEGGIRVPLLAMWPDKIPAGRLSDAPGSSYDWLSTFAEIAGIPVPARTDGVSLLPSLTGKGQQQQTRAYVEYFEGGKTPEYADFAPNHRGRRRNQMQMIRIGDFVGLRYDILSHNDNFEIYKVGSDPQELNDLAAGPEMKQLQQQMKNTVLQLRRPDASAPRPYDSVPVPPTAVSNLKSGLSRAQYCGKFPWVSDVTGLKPSHSGISSAPELKGSTQNNDEQVVFSGYIKVPANGEYTFYLKSGSGALLKMHYATIIDSDFGYQAGEERSGKIMLQAGFHPIKIYSLQKKGVKPLLSLEWSGPGISRQPVPAKVFYY